MRNMTKLQSTMSAIERGVRKKALVVRERRVLSSSQFRAGDQVWCKKAGMPTWHPGTVVHIMAGKVYVVACDSVQAYTEDHPGTLYNEVVPLTDVTKRPKECETTINKQVARGIIRKKWHSIAI